VPFYDYCCPHGHVFEQQVPMAGNGRPQPCPACGRPSGKIPSAPRLTGQASAGTPAEMMPQTWRATHEGSPDYLGQLRKQWGARQKLAEKYPELRGDQRPVIAHEGRYHGAPLRAGDTPHGTTGAPPPA
jgi:putative FmdB family regulatory protein